ncbi:hypothetical protein NE865_01996 [Phthorimaea operculella]|nr:hypothetical protein NE865_01996 [Phthorimaea operculella]
MLQVLSLCLLSCFLAGSQAAPKASFITACKVDDDACILNSAQAAIPFFADGIKELGVTPMDPLVLEDVQSTEGDLKLHFKNLNVAGPRNCKFTKISLGADASHLDFDVECPITATGKYKAEGKLLFVAIEGEGDIEVKTEKVLLKLNAKLETITGADGKPHWHVASYEHTYEPEERIYFKLDNLFGGDESKAAPVLTILNESWKEVINTIGKPIIAEIIAKAKEHIDVFLAAVPAEELYVA